MFLSRADAGRSAAQLPRSVTWGLLAAWVVHDAEELCTMPGWVDRARPRLERTLPGVPVQTWHRLSVSRPHAAAAIGLVGAFVGAAAARGGAPTGPVRCSRPRWPASAGTPHRTSPRGW